MKPSRIHFQLSDASDGASGYRANHGGNARIQRITSFHPTASFA
ncbi:hypothetical protein RMSM_07032 [Rhodopirellula maiorica SM1]|uniref:Uncharacterized protein n=1 Tax=Rhodopirellula maiorica SM1 TaxID=1265738 RepID=M5R9J2_9BACT|nr:hypothetical protein RMSM_07032 [Rhodopirellula maiorica SM1]